jgi:hypothetical protein
MNHVHVRCLRCVPEIEQADDDEDDDDDLWSSVLD